MKTLVTRWTRKQAIVILSFAIALMGTIGYSGLVIPGGLFAPASIAATPAPASTSTCPTADECYKQGELEHARKLWQAAADAAARTGDRLTELQNRLNEAQALKALGAYPRAKEILTAGLTQLDPGQSELLTTDQTIPGAARSQLQAKFQRSLGEVYQATGDLNQAAQVLNQSLKTAQLAGSQEDESAVYFSLGMTARSSITRSAPRLLVAVGSGKERGNRLKVVLNLLDGRPIQLSDPPVQPAPSNLPAVQPAPFNLTDVTSNFQRAVRLAGPSTLAVKAELNQLSLLVDILPRTSRYLASNLTLSDELTNNYADYFITEFVNDPTLRKQLQPLLSVIRTVRRLDDKPEQLTPAIADLAQVQRQTGLLTASLVQGISQMRDRIAQLPDDSDTVNIRLHYAQTLMRLRQVAVETDRVDDQLRQRLKTILAQVQANYQAGEYQPKLPKRSTIDPVFKAVAREFQQPQRSLFLPGQERSTLQQQVRDSLQQATQVLIPAITTAQSISNERVEATARILLAELYSQVGESNQDKQYWARVETLSQEALRLVQTTDAPDLMLRAQQYYARSLVKQIKIPAARSACRVAATTLEANRSNLVTIDQDVQYSFLESVDPFYRECVTVLLPQTSETANQRDLEDARNLIEALQLAELDNFFQEACIEARKGRIDTLIEEQKAFNTAVIYPILLSQRRVGVIAKFPQIKELQYAAIATTEDVEPLLTRFRDQLTDSTSSGSDGTKAIGNTVYHWLVAPFSAQLKIVDTLVFVPDAAFRNLPMAALYDGQRYLIEGFAIAVNPGLQLVNPKTRETPLSAIGAGLIDVPEKFGLQNFSEAEIRREFDSIREAGILTQAPLLESSFTSGELAKQLEKIPFNVVHLSTHAGFSSRKDETYVLMANGKVNVDEFSDILRRRVQQQPGSLELLVLSACQTVSGDNRASLGLAGIAIRSGARSTLATLWTVQEQPTVALIDSFYQEYVNKTTRTPKQTKAKALQMAQLKLKQTTPPYIWASYANGRQLVVMMTIAKP